MVSKILLTGASGFVGKRIAYALVQKNTPLIFSNRKAMCIAGGECKVVDDISDSTDWSHCLGDVASVIHCAARVHVMQETAANPLQSFRQVNVAGTVRLAQQAALAGVKQFIFLSSVKVNGEETKPGTAFTEGCQPKPTDPYGISKFEAEQALFELGRKTGMAITVIRPPLVYGPGVGANFLSLLRLVRRGIPLPLGGLKNQRSFVFIDNLVSLVTCCINNPNAYNQIFLVSDGHDLSTPELLKKVAASFSVSSHLLPCPPSVLMFMANLVGKKSAADRLCQSLQLDISKTKSQLGWSPPYTVEQGLQLTTNYIIESQC
jgi:nucleoside-diphosphate-sugar epimerase